MRDYPSMSYCKFENTLAHMNQIEDDLFTDEHDEEMSSYEIRAKKKILQKIREWATYLDEEEFDD